MKSLSHVRLLATPRTAAHQAPPSMGFSRQEYWSGVPSPSPVRSFGHCQIRVFSLPLLAGHRGDSGPLKPSGIHPGNDPSLLLGPDKLAVFPLLLDPEGASHEEMLRLRRRKTPGSSPVPPQTGQLTRCCLPQHTHTHTLTYTLRKVHIFPADGHQLPNSLKERSDQHEREEANVGQR